MTHPHDVIAAFADGEPVPAGDLKGALAEPDGRDYLIDVLALRGLVTDTRRAEVRRPRLHAASGVRPMESVSGRDADRTPRHRWLTAVAALIVASVVAGYFIGRGVGMRGVVADGASVALSPSAAPAPTHVIRMENGLIWNERAGGN